jgi:hypothetical protein
MTQMSLLKSLVGWSGTYHGLHVLRILQGRGMVGTKGSVTVYCLAKNYRTVAWLRSIKRMLGRGRSMHARPRIQPIHDSESHMWSSIAWTYEARNEFENTEVSSWLSERNIGTVLVQLTITSDAPPCYSYLGYSMNAFVRRGNINSTCRLCHNSPGCAHAPLLLIVVAIHTSL